MRIVLLSLTFIGALGAQALPVVQFQTDPETIVRSLRDGNPPMPAAECRALNLRECHPNEPTRVRDISLRWVQLDTDEPLEAILTMNAKVELSYVAYVFDKQATWNLIGTFSCGYKLCDVDRLIRVRQLTRDSPPLLLCNQALGGSGTALRFYTETFHLRAGHLWPSFKLATYENDPFRGTYALFRAVDAVDNRLVIHTTRVERPGASPRNTCEVFQWDPGEFTFIPNAGERTRYCDGKSGKPLREESFPSVFSLFR